MPLYSEAVLDEIRNAANIVSIVSEYVALRKRGRNHQARCPFHNEKTPSFSVNEEKQIFHCFGCGVGGDVFKFITLVEHISFPEAVRLLAERHGVALPLATAAAPESGVDVARLRGAMAEAAEFYHRLLVGGEEGHGAREYLAERGVTPQSITRFKLGFAPAGGDALLGRLRGAGYTVEELLDCGLVKQSDDLRRWYDAFRGRIMFPIADIQGRVIAFGGRTLSDALPKYLNSAETKLYNKSRHLYGLSHSREGIKQSDRAVLVEGYLDFVIPFQAGVTNVVASLGTSLTPQQVKLLGRYTREVVVSYDPDSAGVTATERSLDLFLEEDFRVKVLRLPAGQDPDAYIRHHGAAAYRDRVEQATPFLEFVLETAVARQGTPGTPRAKIQVLNAVLPYLAKLPNAVERSDYIFQFARKLEIDDRLLLAEVRKAAQDRKPRLPLAALAPAGAFKVAEKRLLQVLLGSPELQADILPRCQPEDFEQLVGERIFAAVLELFGRGGVATYDALRGRFAEEEEQALLARLEMEEVPEEPTRENAESYLSALRKVRLSSFKQQLVSKIADAAKRKDDAQLAMLRAESVRVDRELVSLSRK